MINTPDTPSSQRDSDSLDFDFEIDLDEQDLDAMSAVAPEAQAVHSEPAKPPFDLDELDELAPAAQGNTKTADEGTPKNKTNLIILVGILCVVGALSLLGVFAWKILGGNAKQSGAANQGLGMHQPAAPAEERPQDQAPVALEQDPAMASLKTAQALDEALNSPVGALEAPEPLPSAAPQPGMGSQENLVVTYNPKEAVGAAQPADQAVPEQKENLSDEEKLYDNLLSSVNGMDVPPEAIKIDESVVKRKLESQRFNSMEQELQQARDSVAEIKGSVESMRTQVSSFAQMIEKSSADQARVNESIEQLTATVASANAQHEKDLKELKAAIAAADKRSQTAVEHARAAEAKSAAARQTVREVVVREEVKPVAGPVSAPPVARPAPMPVPSPVQTEQKPIAKVLAAVPQPKKVIAPVAQPSLSSSGLPAHCDGSRVSANWKVKGVNNQSAYVVRPEDKQGLYLQVGVDVPGFGQVQAFDPGSRAVCTTAGLIRR